MRVYQVAASIIRHKDKILIAQRLKDAHMGLKWEFPEERLNRVKVSKIA